MQSGGVSGSSLALEQMELTFGQDLNGDGFVGVVTPIRTDGSTTLAQVNNNYYLFAAGTTTGVELNNGGYAGCGRHGWGWGLVAAWSRRDANWLRCGVAQFCHRQLPSVGA